MGEKLIPMKKNKYYATEINCERKNVVQKCDKKHLVKKKLFWSRLYLIETKMVTTVTTVTTINNVISVTHLLY